MLKRKYRAEYHFRICFLLVDLLALHEQLTFINYKFEDSLYRY